MKRSGRERIKQKECRRRWDQSMWCTSRNMQVLRSRNRNDDPVQMKQALSLQYVVFFGALVRVDPPWQTMFQQGKSLYSERRVADVAPLKMFLLWDWHRAHFTIST